ncbi:DegV family protein [bacterium]|nr:DegV family protein [bacterium]
MKALNILIGTSASITDDIIKKYGFLVVEFKFSWPEGDTIKGDNIYDKMRTVERVKLGSGPKTSQPSIGIYKKAFEDALKDAEKVLYISISSKLSGAYNSAMQAIKMMPAADQEKIFVFDSLNADAAESYFAIRATELLNEGLSIESILEKLNEIKGSVKLFGALESANWLEAGGRINHATAVLMNKMQDLGMRPILIMKEGEIKPATLKMQAKDIPVAMLKELEAQIKDDIEKGKVCRIIISHAGSPENAEKIIEEAKLKYGDKIKIEFVSLTGQVIGAHVGPGALICCACEQ